MNYFIEGIQGGQERVLWWGNLPKSCRNTGYFVRGIIPLWSCFSAGDTACGSGNDQLRYTDKSSK